MERSCLCGSNASAKESSEVSEIADSLTKVFCRCRDETQIKVGAMACELFRLVDLEGQHLEIAANALGIEPGDAKAILAVVRRHVANALVGEILADSIPDHRGYEVLPVGARTLARAHSWRSRSTRDL